MNATTANQDNSTHDVPFRHRHDKLEEIESQLHSNTVYILDTVRESRREVLDVCRGGVIVDADGDDTPFDTTVIRYQGDSGLQSDRYQIVVEQN